MWPATWPVSNRGTLQVKLTYGIIGCGMMGQEHLRNIALLPDTGIAAIYEPDAGMRALAAAAVPGAKMVASIADLLDVAEVNCLLIASPNYLHLAQLEAIASMRPLPVLVEKPLFTAPEDAPRLAALRAAYPAPIWVAMEYRYMPPVARLIEEAEAATGGIKMLSIREHRFPFLEKVGDWNRFNRNTGGTLVEKCCHFFDLMRHILKSDPVRVMASGGQTVNHLDEVYGGERSDIWDNAYVIVDFASGARAMLELCMFAEGSRYQEEISAVGPTGKIECLVPGPGRFWPAHLGEPPVAQVIVSPRDPKGPRMVEIPVDPQLLEAGDHNGSTFYQHQRFQKAVLGTGHVEVALTDGWWAVAMGLAAQDSARSGRAVDISAEPYAPLAHGETPVRALAAAR
ncbi:Gfo/Idh/MocA family oxidoreductase [Microvirga tunisiensis]|uniref:Gfo/Idh/MocA family oxidoreductase n=1 Tax=Pannonibacter tanglangensis TaxID=2750084 RepID=A0ABW9ZHL1_9HYPH|nr:Gfo/Idh/MocA family oxidoreductase [Pannonibacter sp. XCT-34]NBN63924.1 Gfo/Idh/MocA family oxidoreductase [Pannonibacter sp. XCT-34]